MAKRKRARKANVEGKSKMNDAGVVEKGKLEDSKTIDEKHPGSLKTGKSKANKEKEEQAKERSGNSESSKDESQLHPPKAAAAKKKRKRGEGGVSHQDDDDYEGPVDEYSSDEDSEDSSDDDSDESDGEINLAGALRKRHDSENDEDGSAGEEEEEDEEEGEGEQEIVDVNLDFCDPHERFFHGIKALVAHSYLLEAAGGGAGLSPFVDLVVEQGAVGTVLSTDGDGDSDVFAVITALPLRFLAKKHQCTQAVIKFLLKKAALAGRGAEMEAAIGEEATGKVGLLLSERMINCPMQAVPKLHEALLEDIAWAVENEISEEHKDKFRFDSFVVVAPCETVGGGPPAGSGPAMLSDFCFSRFDDEVLLQEAEFFFTMGTAGSGEGAGSATGGSGAGSAARGGGGGSGQRYVVGLVSASKYKECAEAIAQMIA